MPSAINTDMETAGLPSSTGGEVSTFRQARTPKHCNKSGILDEGNSIVGVQRHTPPQYRQAAPPQSFHGQRNSHSMNGPTNHYQPPTSNVRDNPVTGNAFSHGGLPPPHSFFGDPSSSAMISPGRNAYAYNGNNRSDFREQFNSGSWGHEQYPSYNSVEDDGFNSNGDVLNENNRNSQLRDFDRTLDGHDAHDRQIGNHFNSSGYHGSASSSSGPIHNGFTRAVSSSFTDSVKSKSSEKENRRKNPVSNSSYNTSIANPNKNMLNLGKESQDDNSIGSHADSDRSWKALNQVASIDEEKFRKEEKERGSTPLDNLPKNSSLPHPTSETSSLSNSPSVTSRRKEDSSYPSNPTPSKLAPLESLVNVASMQEALDTSESQEGDAKASDPSGPPDLMNCADGGSSGSFLFRSRDDILTKRPREERSDTDTMHKAYTEEIRRAPSHSPPNVANLSMREEGNRPLKKSRGGRSSQQEDIYDKPPAYTFSIDSVPSFTKEGLKGGNFNIRTDSMSTSSLTPLEPLSGRDENFKQNKEDSNPEIPSNMPSWEITGQDSFGGAMTVASNGSGGEGGPLLSSSFSFNNDKDAHTNDVVDPPSSFPSRGAMREGSDKKSSLPGAPAPEMESRNQSFEEVRHQRERRYQPSFHEPIMSHPASNNIRADSMDMGYSENSPPLRHLDSCVPAPLSKQDNNRLPRASPHHEGKFPLHGAVPWNNGNLRPSHSFSREPPEPLTTQHHPNGPHPTHPGSHHGPYHVSHSGSFGGPPVRIPSFDGMAMHRNFSHDSRSSSPGNHYHNLRAGSFGGPPPLQPHHPGDHHLPHAFRPPPPDFSKHPHHLNRRPPPAVYIMSSPSGGRVGNNMRHCNDSSMKRPGGVYSWTKEDDMRLTEIMKKYKNPRDWEPIAKEFGAGKTSKECHERWIRYLKPGVRKGQWQDHEDAIVVEAVTTSTEQPFTRWSDLAQRLPGRVGKQIRDRWVNHLNPNINHMPFTREDDLKLWDGHQKLGKRWVEISTKYFQSSRSENHIKNRWYSASFKKFIASEFGKDAYNSGKKDKVRVTSPKCAKSEVMKVEL